MRRSEWGHAPFKSLLETLRTGRSPARRRAEPCLTKGGQTRSSVSLSLAPCWLFVRCILSWPLLASCREYPLLCCAVWCFHFPHFSFPCVRFLLVDFSCVIFPSCLEKKEREPTVSCREISRPKAWHGRGGGLFSFTATVFFC